MKSCAVCAAVTVLAHGSSITYLVNLSTNTNICENFVTLTPLGVPLQSPVSQFPRDGVGQWGSIGPVGEWK